VLRELCCEVSEVTALCGATLRHREWIAEQDHRALLQELAETSLGCRLVDKHKIIDDVAFVHDPRLMPTGLAQGEEPETLKTPE
jgi:hypothetical protein